MRRIIGGLLAFLVMTGTLLVLPVYAAPAPEAEPVAPSIDALDLGSVEEPVDEAVVTQDGEVLDAGSDAPVDAPTGGETTPVPAAVASSGSEVAAVPALTVAQSRTEPFSAVGVTWAQDDAVTGVTVQLRTRGVDGAWRAWTVLEQDDIDQTSSATTTDTDVRGGTAPYWTDESQGVEVVVQAADGSTPRDVRLELVDPGTSDADAQPGQPEITDTANAALAMPAIFSRAQWGADESLMGWDPQYSPTIKAATIHHTADGNNYSSADVPAIMRGIYAYHAVSRGWGDIGYNVIVDKFGRAWEGRSGGLASTVVGAHAGGFNTSTFGVSMLGNYDLVAPTPAMVQTVAAVIAWKFSLYGVDPGARTTLVSSGGGTSKYAAGASVTLPTIFGHRDVGSTSCPGQYGYAKLGEIRTLVASLMNDPTARQSQAQSFLRGNGGSGTTTLVRGDAGDVPFACDVDGDGVDAVSIFRNGRFFLFSSNDAAAAPVAEFEFGDRGDIPLCGDWDGDGRDTVGVWRAGWFYLSNTNTTGRADGVLAFGNPDAQPLVGNWDGDAYDTVGAFQNATFFWTNSNISPVTAGSRAFGVRSDRALAGDWAGVGRDSIGIFRAGYFYLNNDLRTTRTDAVVPYGNTTDRPLVGVWNRAGSADLGVARDY